MPSLWSIPECHEYEHYIEIILRSVKLSFNKPVIIVVVLHSSYINNGKH